MVFNAPMSEARAGYLIETFELQAGQTVVDFGCGDGEFLRLLASAIPIEGVGIDKDERLIGNAQSSTKNETLEFVCADVNAYVAEMTAVDAIICIGSEYIFDGYEGLLQASKPLLKPNGKLLVGTIYWKQAPSADYLALLNGENPYHDLPTTVEIARQSGFLPLDIGRANDDEWDRFESRTARRRYANPDAAEMTWQWQQGYLKWGMDVMGFCFLLLESV